MINPGKTMAVVVALLAVGCGSKKKATPGPGGGGTENAGPAATEPALNGCTTYKDMREAGAWSAVWDQTFQKSEHRCVKISVNQTVGFTGSFTTHPMKAAGGTTPSPFDAVDAALANVGSEQEGANFLFSTPGTYGFVCSVHPSMTGAVLVVP